MMPSKNMCFPRIGTVLENYFVRQSPTRERELPVHLRYTGSCEPPDRAQMHNHGRVYWERARNHNILSVKRS